MYWTLLISSDLLTATGNKKTTFTKLSFGSSPMSILVAYILALLQDPFPAKLKQLVKVPNTYQNMFSISQGLVSKWERECLCEKASGKIATR